jgi:hypothetical protein
MMNTAYKRLGISIALSFVAMYATMFLNVAETGHIYISLTRLYMSLLMICPMLVIMIIVMGNMYDNKKTNAVLLTSAVVVFTLALTGLRSQTFVGDRQYMKGMISHHSSAILTSRRAHLMSPQVLKLSKKIIKSQEREIGQMKAMLDALADSTKRTQTRDINVLLKQD